MVLEILFEDQEELIPLFYWADDNEEIEELLNEDTAFNVFDPILGIMVMIKPVLIEYYMIYPMNQRIH